MKVKESNGSLELQGDVLEGAEEAFKEGRYVEAFALLHACIDWWMADLIQLSECIRDSSKTDFFLNENEYRFVSSAKCLFCKSIINKEQFDKLIEFNRLRNKIIHRLVMQAYQRRPKNTVTISESARGFEKGKTLCLLLKGKTSLVISNPEVIKGEKPNENP